MTPYSYVIVSIMPDPTRYESLNVGVVARFQDANHCRVIADTSRITTAFPLVSDAMIRQSLDGLERRVRLSTASDIISLARDVLPESTSGLHASAPHLGITSLASTIVDVLFKESVG